MRRALGSSPDPSPALPPPCSGILGELLPTSGLCFLASNPRGPSGSQACLPGVSTAWSAPCSAHTPPPRRVRCQGWTAAWSLGMGPWGEGQHWRVVTVSKPQGEPERDSRTSRPGWVWRLGSTSRGPRGREDSRAPLHGVGWPESAPALPGCVAQGKWPNLSEPVSPCVKWGEGKHLTGSA